MKTSQICTTPGEGKQSEFLASLYAFSIEGRKACTPPEGRKRIPAKVINLAREDGAR
jgi:hypothetical protein